MDTAGPGLLFTLFVFITSFSVIVFIHEWGHYRVARLFGVKITSFAIGFGKEIAGWTDKNGVRWKFCLLPLGGYVKFAGDASAASNPSAEALAAVPEAERAVLFHFKPLWQKALIVAAGPLINLVVPIFIFGGAAFMNGAVITPPVIETVVPESAAEAAGLMPGDRILSIDGVRVSRFRDLSRQVQLKPLQTIVFSVERGGAPIMLNVRIGARYIEDRFGNRYPVGSLGVSSVRGEWVDLSVIGALSEGLRQTGNTIAMIGEVGKQLILGLRSVKEVAGPIRIADMTGQVASQGFDRLVLFLAMISINLGIVNLLPIPGLDGGHLLMYALEALKGGPLPERALEYGYRAGIGLLLIFMVFVFWNDLQSVAL